MNAETGTDTESPKRRGRIPQSAWPRILERYRSGATLSAIAREFECTPSAISYIVRKAEAAGMTGDETAPGEGETAMEGAPVTEDDAAANADAAPEAGAVETAAEAPAAPDAAPAPAPVKAKAKAGDAAEGAGGEAAEPARPRGEGSRGTLRADQLRSDRQARAEPAPAAAPAEAPAAVSATATASTAATAAAAGEAPAAAAPRAGRAEPTPPVDAVEGRLRETARTCLSAYRVWRQQPGENSLQPLADAVHELRKALARIEIDMSASRREEQVARPIPIPAHRAARRAP